jgi:poly(U)-specific endoribonuclease
MSFSKKSVIALAVDVSVVCGAMFIGHAGAQRVAEHPKPLDQRRVKFGDNFLDLVLHPEATGPPNGSGIAPRGEHVRTLWPKFRSAPVSAPAGEVDLPTQPHNDSPVRIARALPNPVGSDESGEWVELENVTEGTSFDLGNWRLMDQKGREQPMSGSLAAGETRRIDLTRDDANSMMLKNDPGVWILLFQGETRRAAVRYDTDPAQEEIFEFD